MIENLTKKIYKPVVTMGTFDGLHLGHQALLQEVVNTARATGGTPTVLTYCHHPLETLQQKPFPYLLTERQLKEELIRKAGIEQVLYLRFDQNMATLAPEDFVRSILVDELQTSVIICGWDTHFGRDRQGNYQLLQALSEQFNYKVMELEPVKVHELVVSSSLIRELIRGGNVDRARAYLGRPYAMLGNVVRGRGDGKRLHFPTVNLDPVDPYKLIPVLGVYAGLLLLDGKLLPAAINIGRSPSVVENGPVVVEAHLPGFSGDLYGKTLELFFLQHLRSEEIFSDEETLKDQITQDVEQVLQIAAREH